MEYLPVAETVKEFGNYVFLRKNLQVTYLLLEAVFLEMLTGLQLVKKFPTFY
jgi:hypothetical protein